MVHVTKCVCLIDYNCIIILLSVTVFVCHDKVNVFLYNKFTSILETTCIEFLGYYFLYKGGMMQSKFDLSLSS